MHNFKLLWYCLQFLSPQTLSYFKSQYVVVQCPVRKVYVRRMLWLAAPKRRSSKYSAFWNPWWVFNRLTRVNFVGCWFGQFTVRNNRGRWQCVPKSFSRKHDGVECVERPDSDPWGIQLKRFSFVFWPQFVGHFFFCCSTLQFLVYVFFYYAGASF